MAPAENLAQKFFDLANLGSPVPTTSTKKRTDIMRDSLEEDSLSEGENDQKNSNLESPSPGKNLIYDPVLKCYYNPRTNERWTECGTGIPHD
jgi:hypothetical protein